MVRASTRSKTTASLAASKDVLKKKPAAVKDAAAKATVTVKAKTKAAPKPPPRKGTRTSTRGKKQDAEEEEKKDGNVSEDAQGGDADEVPVEEEQQDEAQPETSEATEVPAIADQDQAEEETRPLEPQDREDLTIAVPDGSERTYCICNGADDGSPMITCEVCDNWFHFQCIEIDEDQADDIGTYICPKCHETTGRSTTMKWELTSEDGKKAQDDKAQEDQEDQEEDVLQGSPSEAETPRPAPSSS
ncbi:hypothetical protein M407DRAFT_25805, partial [Tulasnella calospora MUT 4182]